jgi:hypothetical protein
LGAAQAAALQASSTAIYGDREWLKRVVQVRLNARHV